MSIDPRLPNFVGAPPTVNNVSDLQRQMLGMLGNSVRKQAIRTGSGTLVWNSAGGSSKTSDALTITHGLNRVPAAILVVCAQMSDGSAYTSLGSYDLSTLTDQSVDLHGQCVDHVPAVKVNCRVNWVAFG